MWGEENVSTARCGITHEWILQYDWYIFLVVDDHIQEAIYPKWIFSLMGFFNIKHLFEDCVCILQFLQGWNQNNNISYGQLDHNVGISDFKPKQMKMNFH